MNGYVLRWLKGSLVFLIAGVIAVMCARASRTEIVEIEIVAESSEIIDYQLSSPDFSQNLQDALKIQNTYINQPEALCFAIPVHVISQLQLTFNRRGNNSEELIIHQVKVNGKNMDLTQLVNSCVWQGIESVDIQERQIILKGCNDRAFILFPDEIKFQGKRQYNWYLIVSSFLIAIIIAWAMIFRYFPTFYIRNKESINDSWMTTEKLIFCSIVSVILIYPITHIDLRESSSQENRVLAKFPSLYNSQGINIEFGRQFDAWLSDRFAERSKFIRLHDMIDAFLNFGHRENASAFEGKDGWLFYKGDNSVKLYQHLLPFTDGQLQMIKGNLEKQTSWLQSQNIVYSVLVAPNKEDIYSEFYDSRIVQSQDKDRIQQLKDYMDSSHSEASLIYPRELLISKKNEEHLLYWKQDTHWNLYGAYWAYLIWMQELKKLGLHFDILEPNQMQMVDTIHKGGDLARMLRMDQTNEENISSYSEFVPVDGWRYEIVETKEDKGGTPKFIRTVCSGRPYKVLVFRDSFSNALLPYISSTFGEVIYVWDHDLNSYVDIIRQEKPDIILHEMVSRYAMALLQNTDSWQGKVK